MDTPQGDIMGPGAVGWREFIAALSGFRGLKVRVGADGGVVWDCPHDDNLPIARKMLQPMLGINVSASILNLQSRGASCDCKIFWDQDVEDLLGHDLEDALENLR